MRSFCSTQSPFGLSTFQTHLLFDSKNKGANNAINSNSYNSKGNGEVNQKKRWKVKK